MPSPKPVPPANEAVLTAARQKVWDALPGIVEVLIREARGDKEPKPAMDSKGDKQTQGTPAAESRRPATADRPPPTDDRRPTTESPVKGNYNVAKFLFDFALIGTPVNIDDSAQHESLAALLLRHIGPAPDEAAPATAKSATPSG